ncbi:thyroid adenoma-associated protein homolog [Spea bombifrons]|uniref:thyroid adenoma-associated protein homolog n=1 Tax=Spea bombifrons TaxID=233779 RepID=UPI002349D324|nr:thyroid adenoma-associated protein homolog [Spea bombifrons]
MLEHLLPAVSDMCKGQIEHYYCFQVLSLWLQRVREQITGILQSRKGFLWANDSKILSDVMQLLWAGAEKPIDGMSGLVLSCFQHCLHIHQKECQILQLNEEILLQDVLQKITDTSWQNRSRYTPLCSLLPFIGADRVLALYPQLPTHLFFCLSTNYLCPPAAETYRAVITLQRKEWTREAQLDEKALAKRWAVSWLTPLCDALCSTESSLQSNAATHILPCSLSCFSESFALLEEKLEGQSPASLRGWVSLVRAQKALGRANKDIEDRLQVCLGSADDGVRLDALCFLCCGSRSSQPPSSWELKLLKRFLPYNLGCDSAGFRQQLQSAVRRALERLRDGALTALRKGLPQEKAISLAIDFLEWLCQLSVSCMSSAGNYQRRCSGLLIFSALLESYTDCWTPEKKKGQPPQDMAILLKYARQRGCWDFFSAHNTQALVGCLQDSTNEIREMASDLLVRFFMPIPDVLFLTLFELSKASLCSPRVPQAEAGALIMKTLLLRPQGVVVFPGDAPLDALHLVTFLAEMLRDQYCYAQENLLQAATSKPLHGVLSALRLCLLEVPVVSQSFSKSDVAPSWCCLLQGLVRSLREIVSFILNVLHRSWNEDIPEAVAPSFADMGKAVSTFIAEGRGLEEMPGSVLLSEEYSLIMTFCWVSLKEIGVLLGPLVEKLISGPVAMLPLSAVQESVVTYQDIFMRCRHWGAVDGCSAGFTKLCSALFHNEDSKLRAIPQKIMEQVLAECRSRKSLSVTRRAAGFPVLLQSILCGEGAPHMLLASCVHSLLVLANEPLPADWDQTHDLPQVSAVHALQTMLRCSVLRATLLTQAVPMMSLALQNLRSACWAMRNAALQLFSALTGGMLGLSRSDGDSLVQSTLSAGALLRRFPGLRDVLIQELQDATYCGNMLHPSLHPILTLLARLQPGGDTEAGCFLKPLLGLAKNPIYAVRVMAARAVVPVVQVMEYRTVLFQLVGTLPHVNKGVSHNALHGCLLQIHALLAVALKENCLEEGDEQQIAKKLLPALWLASPEQRCPVVRASFLDVLSLLVPVCGKEFAMQVWEAVCSKQSGQDYGKQVGFEVFHEAYVVYLCNEAVRSSDPAVHSHVCDLLLVGDHAVFRWLKKQHGENVSSALYKAVRYTLQDKLYSVLLSEHSPECLRLYLEAFVDMNHSCFPTLILKHPKNHMDLQCAHILLTLLQSSTAGPQLRGHALCTLSLLLTHRNLREDISLCSHWLSVLAACADPASSCEELRLAAARALEICGAYLVRHALSDGAPDITKLAVRTVGYGVDLLQDEERNVREAATRFAVAAIDQPAEVTLQSDRALLHLLQLLRDHFWTCEETFHVLLVRLPPFDLYSALSTLQVRSASLYEEDEPNVFADSFFLSSLLLPVLCALLDLMSTDSSLCSVLLRWVKCTVIPLREQMQQCHHWGQAQGPVSQLRLKASGCPRVQTAILGLLVHGQMLTRALEVLPPSQIAHLGLQSGCVEEELAMLKEDLRLYGIGSTFIKIIE